MEPVKKPEIKKPNTMATKSKSGVPSSLHAQEEAYTDTIHPPQEPKQPEIPVTDTVLEGDAGVDADHLADKSYNQYLLILEEFHSDYFKINRLEPQETDEEILKQEFRTDRDTAKVCGSMVNFMIQYFDYLMKTNPPGQENQLPITETYHQNTMELLEAVKAYPFKQYENFIDSFQEYFLCKTIDNWYAEKIANKEYLQAKKNIEKKQKLTKESKEFTDYLGLVSGGKILSDAEIQIIISDKEKNNISERVGSFGKEEGLKSFYEEFFVKIKQILLTSIENKFEIWKKKPKSIIDNFDTEFNQKITKYKTDKILTNTVFKNAKDIDALLMDKRAKLKENVKTVYVNILKGAVLAPDFLDISETHIVQISNYYKDNIISKTELDNQIKAGIAKQYSPPKQVWLEDILKFADANKTGKNTTGDDCADLTSEANKETHSTLYRENVPDCSNVKEKSNAEIYNLVLGNISQKCFHVSTNSFFNAAKGKEIAAHSYRVGAEILYYDKIGANFSHLTETQLCDELKAIKDYQVAAKETLLFNAINNHFHGYQKISDTVFVKKTI